MVVLFNNYTSTNKNMTVKGLGTELRKYQTTGTENMADKGSTKIVSGSATAASKVWCSSSRMPVVKVKVGP